jgi:hypothetical protein
MTLADLTVDIVPIVRPSPVNDATGPAICSSKGPTCEPSSTSLLVYWAHAISDPGLANEIGGRSRRVMAGW